MTHAVQHELENQIEGEVRFDRVSRALYSTDASVYQIEPLGVVVPRSRDDVVRTVQIAKRHGCSITARGGGTSQAGQAIGSGLQLDTSKYLNHILELNVAERWARVEPGIVLDELNLALRPHGLRFAPDISTASRATIGGMIANNASGARSILYGKTIDHVLELDLVLADGSVERLGALQPDQLAAACAGEQDRFWQMHDRLWENPQKLAVPELKAHAQALGLDATAFASCLDSSRHAGLVERDMQAGQAYGVSGTPAFFVNGRPLIGAQPFEAFQQVIDDELARAAVTRAASK